MSVCFEFVVIKIYHKHLFFASQNLSFSFAHQPNAWKPQTRIKRDFVFSIITATGFLRGYRWGKPEFKKTPPARRQGQNRISLRLKIVHRNSPPFLSGERFFRLVLRVGFGFVLGLWQKRGILGKKSPGSSEAVDFIDFWFLMYLWCQLHDFAVV
mgnify:CR=1 FL=1